MARASRTVQRARRAVRTALEDHLALLAEESIEDRAEDEPDRFSPVALVGVSGGADSLALLAATAVAVRGTGLEVQAVVVDHGLQDGSERVAQRAADRCADLGIRAHRRRPDLDPAGSGGVEAVARRGRYAAFEQVRAETRALAVLLAHTADDQAEQVLMALARGSGTRTIAGIPRRRGLLLRPFLGDGTDDELRLARADTEQVCRETGLDWWEDPMNVDPAFLRSRVRHEALPVLEQALGEQVRTNLARSADLARADADLLDDRADDLRDAVLRPPRADHGPDAGPGHGPDAEPGHGPDAGTDEQDALAVLDAVALAAAPGALRRRVLLGIAREAALAHGGRPGKRSGKTLTSVQVHALDALVTAWRGQGPVPLPGSIECVRRAGRLVLRPRSGDSDDR